MRYYMMTVKNIATDEVVRTKVYNHWPTQEAWEIELNDYNVRCVICKI